MRSFTFAFLLGILLLQYFSHLPDIKIIWPILFVIFLIKIFFKKNNFINLLCASAFGFVFVLWYSHANQALQLPKQLEGKTIYISGFIASIPDISDQRSAFLFSLKKINNVNASGKVRLSCRDKNINLHVGDEWQFAAKLKKIHSTMNPGGFDYEALAFQQGISASGYIILHADNKLISSHWYHSSLDRIRECLKEKIEMNLPRSQTSPWIVALALGERHHISQENWQVLRNTGTNHLMAIAGLHIGFIAGFFYAIINWIWRRFPNAVLKLPAPFAASIGALMIAVIYSALAGFSIPTQRACIMLTTFILILLSKRKIMAWHAFCFSLLLVLILNPLNVLTESFWLSFGSVALIIYGVSGRLAAKGLWWKWGRIQWVIALGLIPLSIWLFQQFSFVSFIANSIAIPIVGFLIVPFTLLGCFTLLFSAKIGGTLLFFADKILSGLWIILTYLSHLSWSSWYLIIPNHWMIVAAVIGMVLLLLPAGFPGRFLGIIWVLPLIFFKPLAPALGEVCLTLLDVGQGLSAVIQTQKHILIFDTGPRLSENFDMGESVVVPFIHSTASKKIDMLVISHGDNDHIGGAKAILNQYKVSMIKTSVPDYFPNSLASYCLRGEHWQWDNVQFDFLYPTKENLNLGNDSSCVLRITTGDKHILLTGDIEKLAEDYLSEQIPESLNADILIAPHHGSKTSAVNHFLKNVNPHAVLFSVGYRNRYHFPHASVVEKYHALGAKDLSTVDSGAIQFFLSDKNISIPTCYRIEHQHFWNYS